MTKIKQSPNSHKRKGERLRNFVLREVSPKADRAYPSKADRAPVIDDDIFDAAEIVVPLGRDHDIYRMTQYWDDTQDYSVDIDVGSFTPAGFEQVY